MSQKVYSVPGLFGNTLHYDESGNKVGESWPGLFGGSQEHYDANGNHIGSSHVGLFSEQVYYGENGYAGRSDLGLFGERNHYNKDGDFIGDTWDTMIGETSNFTDSFDF